jgi:hypothetical protein
MTYFSLIRTSKRLKERLLDEIFLEAHIFSWDLGSERSKAQDH